MDEWDWEFFYDCRETEIIREIERKVLKLRTGLPENKMWTCSTPNGRSNWFLMFQKAHKDRCMKWSEYSERKRDEYYREWKARQDPSAIG